MATADQVKSLIKAHIEQDDEGLKQSPFKLQLMKLGMGMILLLVSLSSMQKKLVKGKRT